jgi:hypothetical protein
MITAITPSLNASKRSESVEKRVMEDGVRRGAATTLPRGGYAESEREVESPRRALMRTRRICIATTYTAPAMIIGKIVSRSDVITKMNTTNGTVSSHHGIARVLPNHFETELTRPLLAAGP